MASEMVMLNTRMERDLRERGNAVLAEMGITPSQYVRAMWEKLAGGWHQAKAQVEAVMTPARTPEKQAEIDRKLEALARGDKLFYEFAEQLDLDPALHTPITDEELEDERYQYYLDKLGA